MSPNNEVSIVSNEISALVAPEQADTFDFRWFDIAFWQNNAIPVSAGGRGSAWFIDSGKQAWVLRLYKRGGVVSQLVSSSYLYLGTGKSRPFREFRILSELYSSGFPVPEPIAAMVKRAGLVYTGAIIVGRILNARPMGDCLQDLDTEAWRAVGKTVRRFHDAGVYHADLNCFNILLRGREVFLIDFDKARFFSEARNSSDEKWKAKNLKRLKRSIDKLYSSDTHTDVAPGWAALLTAYNPS
ncbi:3-deoxy-D-manno-octulosonic acid kinase [Marinobacter sp. MBR-99]|uniref:3-deoxy-D-manno-octulosonic acid kinase n=1 Tax=Marinobacter sp. MBR-99 TaxID=3156461 RepID=UPI00339577EB